MRERLRLSIKRLKLRPKTEEAGFSVLEAMVAIAIMAACLLPLFALQGQFVNVVGQIERVELQIEARDQALEVIKLTDFNASPEVQFDYSQYQIRLSAKRASNTRPVKNSGGTSGRFEMTLYDVAVTIEYLSGNIDSFTVKELEWQETSGYLEGL
jgi:general secretion pathway protein I